MASINLLPWRDIKRDYQKKQYLSLLCFSMGLSFCVVFFVGQYIKNEVSKQDQRNAYLQQHIVQFDDKITQIRVIQTRRTSLENRIELIERLRLSRTTTAHLFSSLVAQLPSGIQLVQISRMDDYLMIDGRSNSNNQLAQLVRNLDSDVLFSDVELTSITANTRQRSGYDTVSDNTRTAGVANSDFRIQVSLSASVQSAQE